MKRLIAISLVGGALTALGAIAVADEIINLQSAMYYYDGPRFEVDLYGPAEYEPVYDYSAEPALVPRSEFYSLTPDVDDDDDHEDEQEDADEIGEDDYDDDEPAPDPYDERDDSYDD